MGLSDLPRLYFKGQFFWSPSTYNNNDYTPALETYDPVTTKLDWSFLREQGVHTDEEFKKWSIKAVSTEPSKPAYNLPPSEWGYYGGNQSGFVTESKPAINDQNFSVPIGHNRGRTITTGYTTNQVNYVDKDPWVGLPLQFNMNFKPAKLVDINPTLPWTSQIFSDDFTIGSKKEKEGFTAPVKYRMHSRWIYTKRNYNTDGRLIIAGGISTFFQTVVHKEDITFFNEHPEPGSYQDQLMKGLEKADGIMIRFTVYDTVYFQGKPFDGLHVNPDANNDQLSELMERIAVLYQNYEKALADYNAGKIETKPNPPVNRAYSRAVGWTGLWHQDELVSMADGRILLPLVIPGQPDGLPTPQVVQPKDLPASFYTAPDSKTPPPAAISLGPANIMTHEDNGVTDRISVDLGSTMPELNSTGKFADFGKVQLKLLQLENGQICNTYDIADLPNDLDSYNKTAGVYDITDIPEEVKSLIGSNPLALYVDSYDSKNDDGSSTLALIENPVISNTNDRGVYVNQPDPYWESWPNNDFQIKVQYYGKPPKEGQVNISIGQYTSAFKLITEPAKKEEGTTFTPTPIVELSVDGTPIQNDSVIPVSDNGLVTVGVRALQPGLPFLVFYPFLTDGHFEGIDKIEPAPTYFSYNAIRSLPFDNNLAEDFESWLAGLPKPSQVHDLVGRVNQRVFDDVFRTFHLMYPVMGFIGCPTQFQEWRGRILKLTDPNEFNSAAYMPVTRSLSAGQRRILEVYAEFLGKLPSFKALSQPNPHHFDR